MTYKEQLLARIADSDQWPNLERPEFIEELEDLAHTMVNKGTTEGYLAALLIYHQLTEEMARVLLRCSHLLIQLSVYPMEIQFGESGKQMFGRMADDIKATIAFEGRDEFLADAWELNTIRIEFVHNLTKQSSVSEIGNKVLTAREVYLRVAQTFLVAYDQFRLAFKDFRKDVFDDEEGDE